MFGVFLMGLWAWLAFGLWHLQESARLAAIGFETYEFLSLVSGLAHPETRQLMIQHILEQGVGSEYAVSPEVVGATVALVARFVIPGIMIWFLIKKRKSAFVKSTSPAQAST